MYRKERVCFIETIASIGNKCGALVREAEHAESKSDFIHKMAVAQKEISESIYWLELLKETAYLDNSQFESINKDAVEIITSSIKTAKTNS